MTIETPRVFLPKHPLRHGIEGLTEFGEVVVLLKKQCGNPCNNTEAILELLAAGLKEHAYRPSVDYVGLIGPQIEVVLLGQIAIRIEPRVRLVCFDPMRRRLIERALNLDFDVV